MSFSHLLFSQTEDNDRKGYIGIALGPAFKAGDFKGNGAQLNLVNFGYLFSKHIGMSGTWAGVAFETDNVNSRNNTVCWGGILLGPMFSCASPNKKFDFDLRLQIGYSAGSFTKYDLVNVDKEHPAAMALGGGVSVRWNFWKYMSLSSNFDYYHTKPDFGGSIGKFNMSSTAFTIGVNYRLK